MNFNPLDLVYVKEYLKVDFAEDDNLITLFSTAAKSYVETILGYKMSVYIAPEEAPAEWNVAILMIIAHWYDNRQIQQVGTLGIEMSLSVHALLDAHKDHMKAADEKYSPIPPIILL